MNNPLLPRAIVEMLAGKYDAKIEVDDKGELSKIMLTRVEVPEFTFMSWLNTSALVHPQRVSYDDHRQDAMNCRIGAGYDAAIEALRARSRKAARK